MENQELAVESIEESNWKTRVVLFGGVLGTLIGALSAYLYVRAAEEAHGADKPPTSPRTGDAVRLGVSVLSIVRTITDWGKR